MASETEKHFDKIRAEKAAVLNDEMSKQSSFFEMRARHFTAMLLQYKWMPVAWVFKRAHKAACADYFARAEEAMAVMAAMKEKMAVPVSYRLLKGIEEAPVKSLLQSVNNG